MEFSWICPEFLEFCSPVCTSATCFLRSLGFPFLTNLMCDTLHHNFPSWWVWFPSPLSLFTPSEKWPQLSPCCLALNWGLSRFFLSETLSGGLFLNFYLFIWAVLGLRCCLGFSPGGWAGLICHRARTSPCSSLSLYRVQAPDAWACVVVAHRLGAPRHVGSSQTRDRTHVPCIVRWILSHWTTREVPQEGYFW